MPLNRLDKPVAQQAAAAQRLIATVVQVKLDKAAQSRAQRMLGQSAIGQETFFRLDSKRHDLAAQGATGRELQQAAQRGYLGAQRQDVEVSRQNA